jgi:periplasmic divalent cation tolerance protein
MTVMTDCVVAMTTLPADFDARSLAEALVTDGLAACVAVVPSIESVYTWEGVLQHDREQQVVIKTTRERVGALWTALRERHPYEVPEFLVLPVVDGNPTYLDWVARSARPPSA